jgi:cytoskeletal protein CcmA (bactofilin family)
MPREATKAEKHTLIEQGTEFKGTMKSSCPVVVNGRIEGDLSAPELEVTASGAVQGNIKAERLTSRGILSGNVDAGDLFLSGAIGSKTVIKAKNLEVKLTPEQGRMELTIGECTLDVGEEPTKERRLDPNTKLPLSSSSSGGHGYPLPVTKPSEAPSAMAVEKMESPLATAVADAKEESKASRGGGAPISKPPAAPNEPARRGDKKLRDSVPPGA